VRPTTRELVDGIANALERQVSPFVQDKWAASVLRSALQLLRHVAVRVEDEARLLIDDNADAARTLEGAVRHLQHGPDVDALRSMIASTLQAPAPAPYDAVQLAEHNERLQAAIEQLLRRQGAPDAPDVPDAPDEASMPGEAAMLDETRAYLQRRLAREQHLYFPVFSSPPF